MKQTFRALALCQSERRRSDVRNVSFVTFANHGMYLPLNSMQGTELLFR